MEFEDTRHDQFYHYWVEKKGARRAPSREDIDPLDIPSLLPNIFLFDVFHDPLNYRMRLVGTRIVDIMGRDCTGMYFEEIYGEAQSDKIRTDYDKVALKFKPVYSEISAGWMDRDYVCYYRLMLPLSSDNERVDMMIGCTTFTKK